MDISKLPKEGMLSKTSSLELSKLSTADVVPLERLKLSAGQSATGKVIIDLPSFLARNANDGSAPKQAGRTVQQSNWLVAVKGQVINVQSEVPLKIGQPLLLQLSADGQSLSVLSPSSPKANQAVTNALPAETVTTLLRAINVSLPEQVNLARGFEILKLVANQSNAPLNTTDNSGTGQNPNSNLAKALLSSLSTQLLSKTDLTRNLIPAAQEGVANANASQATVSAKGDSNSASNLKAALLQSGLFFEHSLSSSGQSRTSFQQLVQLAQNLNRESSVLTQAAAQSPTNRGASTGEPQAPSPTQNTGPNSMSNSTLNSASSTPLTGTLSNAALNTRLTQSIATLMSALNNPASTQQTTPSLPDNKTGLPNSTGLMQQLASLRTSLMTSGASSATPGAPDIATATDLKGLLTALTVLMQGSDASGDKPLNSLIDPALQQQPFNFPPVTTQAMQKAEAILADQELTTGQLLKLLAGMLNRLQFNQLNSLYQAQNAGPEGSTTQSWFFELPIMGEQQINTFNIRIDKEESQAREKDDPEKKSDTIQWKLALSFDFDELGAIYIQTLLTPPSISSTIWANNSNTLAILSREQAYFRDRLAGIGLDVGDIVCRYGQPQQNKAKLDRSLVDIQA